MAARPEAKPSAGLALLALLLGAAGWLACPATMHDVAGRRVFNPFYRAFLDSPGRAIWQRPDEVIRALDLAQGAVVAEIGAGTGYFTAHFARAVGPAGRVIATDVQPEMIGALEELARGEPLANVTVVHAGFDDPSLPDACCDLVFLGNVYKELSGRGAYLRRLAAALRPEGRIAVVDFRPGAPGLGPPQEVRLPEEQVVAELAEAGFDLAQSHGFLERQYFLVFARAAGAP
jgi:ubiquinone/menaquinone biosynthesis C-methylase UbiE